MILVMEVSLHQVKEFKTKARIKDEMHYKGGKFPNMRVKCKNDQEGKTIPEEIIKVRRLDHPKMMQFGNMSQNLHYISNWKC